MLFFCRHIRSRLKKTTRCVYCVYIGSSLFGQQQQQQQSGGLSSGGFAFGANSNKGPSFGAPAATATTTTGNNEITGCSDFDVIYYVVFNYYMVCTSTAILRLVYMIRF